MNVRARVAVVGAGWWSGRVHLPALAQNEDADLVAVSDRNIERARHAASLFGIPHAESDHTELLKYGLDCVIIATGHAAHYAEARTFLEAGVDVLVEKPMTVSAAEAWDLVDIGRRTGARVHVGYTFVHSPYARALRQRILDGDIGQLVVSQVLFATGVQALLRGDQRQRETTTVPTTSGGGSWADPSQGGGQLHGQLTHGASLLLWLTAARPSQVSAFSNHLDATVDLADTLAIQFEDGSIANMTTTATVVAHESRMEEYRIFGTEGHLALDTHLWRYSLTQKTSPVRSWCAADPRAVMADCEIAPSRVLVAAALGKADVVATGELGAMTTALLCAAAESARTGASVTVQNGPATASS